MLQKETPRRSTGARGPVGPVPHLRRDFLILGHLFYLIYTPSILGVAVEKYIILLAVPGMALVHSMLARDAKLFQRLRHPGLPLLMATTFVLSLYLMVVQVANRQIPDSLADLRFVQNNSLILVALNVAIVVEALRRRGYTNRHLLNLLFAFASAQGLLAILGLIIPAVRELSLHFYQIGAETQRNSFVIESRIFGIASDYTYATPIYHGTLAGLAFHALMSRKGHILHVPVIALALTVTALNGRTGLVAFAAIAVLSIIYSLFARLSVLAATVALLGITFATWLAVQILGQSAPRSLDFISGMFQDSRNLLVHGELSGNYTVLIPDLLRVPDSDVHFIFGMGIRLFTESPNLRSDVGFTNDLFAGGLIFVVLMYGALLAFITLSQTGQPFWVVSMIAIFAIANFKGEVFRSSTLLFMFLFLALINYGAEKTQPAVSRQELTPTETERPRTDTINGPSQRNDSV